MKKNNLLLAFFIILFTMGSSNSCTVDNTQPPLPEEYIKCEHVFTPNHFFKYEIDNATKYPDAFCLVDNCVAQFEIIDLHGERWVLNEFEIENEWVCITKNNK